MMELVAVDAVAAGNRCFLDHTGYHFVDHHIGLVSCLAFCRTVCCHTDHTDPEQLVAVL